MDLYIDASIHLTVKPINPVEIEVNGEMILKSGSHLLALASWCMHNDFQDLCKLDTRAVLEVMV